MRYWPAAVTFANGVSTRGFRGFFQKNRPAFAAALIGESGQGGQNGHSNGVDADSSASLVVRRGSLSELQPALGRRELDCVLSDRTLDDDSGPRPYSHSVGRSEIGLFGAPDLARRLRDRELDGLSDVPLVLPAHSAAARRTIDAWMADRDLAPRITVDSTHTSPARS